jgi:thiol-disulfide isomerase/thioredoxin
MQRFPRYLIYGMLVWIVTSCSRPDFQLLTGEEGSFSNWRGKWVLINYWALWCEPCRGEIPELNAFYNQHQQQNVLVMGVNYDGVKGNVLKNQAEKMAIHFPVLTQDPAKALGLNQPDVLPITYIMNPEGKLVRKLLGPQTQLSLQKAISELSK